MPGCSAAGRYHLYVSLACPWAAGCLAVLHVKARAARPDGRSRLPQVQLLPLLTSAALRTVQGLEGAIGLSVAHPTWQRTRPGDPADAHTGWAFAAPTDPPLANAAGSFGCEGCIPDTGGLGGVNRQPLRCPPT